MSWIFRFSVIWYSFDVPSILIFVATRFNKEVFDNAFRSPRRLQAGPRSPGRGLQGRGHRRDDRRDRSHRSRGLRRSRMLSFAVELLSSENELGFTLKCLIFFQIRYVPIGQAAVHLRFGLCCSSNEVRIAFIVGCKLPRCVTLILECAIHLVW